MKRIMVVLFVILFAGCSLLMPSLKDKLIGTWVMDSDPGYTITFRANGTMINSDSRSGTWTLTNDTLVMSWSGGSSSTARLTISGDIMILETGFLQFGFTRL